jgi:iron complex outermembrane receptor protein
MIKKSLISSAIAAVLFSSNTLAGVVKGKVVDQSNQPISGAKLHLHGKSQSVTSDANGQFTISVDADSQLHISKNNYIDERIDVKNENNYVTVKLMPSAVESIVVFASALHKNNVEMASPVSVIGGDELKNSAKPTLGETLKGIPGINASYFGPVSSSPIIRGLDGPRVKITQNGLDSSDASRVGPDHANSNDSLSAQQIEVLRGPATLLYGSGAIGGVVNVVDNRIPSDLIDSLSGAAEYSHDTVSSTNTYAALLETGNNGFNFHFDGVARKGGDYETPSFELPSDEHHEDENEDEHDEHATMANTVENTFIDSQHVNFGTSYINDHLTVGLSYGRIDTDYGIPAHSHAHHDHEDHGGEHEDEVHDEGSDDHSEDNVYAKVEQDRWQGLINYAMHDQWIEAISIRAGYTDYTHSEIEGSEVGTTFSNKSQELRVNLEHKLGQWHGIFGYHFSDSDYKADGEEAFTPATKTKTHAVYLLEERQFGNFTIELGTRLEDYKLSSTISSHDHDHEDHDENDAVAYQLDMTNFSASVGGVYQYDEGHNIAINLSRSERAPLTAELLSNGVHIATGTYELGLGYHVEGHDIHFEPQEIRQETSTNIDLSLRRFIGDFGYTVNLFHNNIDNYYYQQNTGLMFSNDHGVEVADPVHEDTMQVFKFVSHDARLYGIEIDAHYNINDKNRVKLFADTLNAELKSGQALPRIPSSKLGIKYEYENAGIKANMTVTRYAKQDDITSYETETVGYTLVDASVQYDFSNSGIDFVAYANLDNLTDELGFVHTSFIKTQAPLPGRNLKLGIRAYF